jgi:hypothetical protein
MPGTMSAAFSEGTTIIYDSGVVGAGAAITTGKMDVRRFGHLIIAATNADASVRSLNFGVFLPEGLTSFGSGTFTNVASGGIWQIFSWGIGGVTSFPAVPGHVSLTLAASGATTARIVVWGR